MLPFSTHLFSHCSIPLNQPPCVAGSGGHHPRSVPGHQEAHGTLSGQHKLIFVVELKYFFGVKVLQNRNRTKIMKISSYQ
jgi:hypothetical protein